MVVAKGNLGITGASGLIRYCLGFWIQGFAINTGIYSYIKSELWAVIIGLEFAWSFGICQLILESNSFVVVNLIAQKGAKLDSNYALVTKAQ